MARESKTADNGQAPLPVTVIGAGAWGTALAIQAARCGHLVTMWAYEDQVVDEINQRHENRAFLPGFTLAENIRAANDLESALSGARLILLVMPSHVFRAVLTQAKPFIPDNTILTACSKGIEQDSGFTMCEVAADVLPPQSNQRLCALSGPSFAKEVAGGVPTAVTVASAGAELAGEVQRALSSPVFRIYTSDDLVGVELGGAVKNPLAIAAGMVSGLGLGHNTVAALITRGLAEMTRLSRCKGGHPATASGLAGLGDLVLTCTGDLSRNRTVGYRLGQGESIDQITSSMQTVAEGVHNTKTILALAQRCQVEMPIISAVNDVIYRGVPPQKALNELMIRDLKPELY